MCQVSRARVPGFGLILRHFILFHPLLAAIFIAKDAVLTSFALGRQTSLVIDAGHEATVGTR